MLSSKATQQSDTQERERNPLLLSVDEVAALTGVSRSLLYLEIKAGRLPLVRLGRRVSRIRSSDLQAYIDSLPQVNQAGEDR